MRDSHLHAAKPLAWVAGGSRGLGYAVAERLGSHPGPASGRLFHGQHAAVGFARGLSAELAGSGISVTTIIPGLMRTGGHWHADFHGRPSAEYGWFTALSATPIVAVDARRAARIIVAGVLAGRRKIIFTLPARIGDS